MTTEEAIAFYASGKWEQMSKLEIAKFQINEPKLCVPFEVFHEAVEHVLERPIFTHQFATDLVGMIAEINAIN